MEILVEYFISHFYTGFTKNPDISQAESENKGQFLLPLQEYIPNLAHLNIENYLHTKPKENMVDFLWSTVLLFCK